MKLRINFKEMQIAFLFIFLSRTINMAIFDYPILDTTYTMMSRIVAVGCVALFIARYGNLIFKFKYHYIVLFALCLGVSTIISDGNIRRYIMTIYPIAAMCAYIALNCATIEKAQRFIHSITWLFTILVTINTLFLFLLPNLFQGRYFLGLENQIGHPLTVGFLFAYLNKIFNNEKKVFNLYVIIYFITILRIFSANNVVGAMILAMYIFIVPVKKYLQKNRLTVFAVCFISAFFSLVILSYNALLNVPFVKFIIQDVLGKSLTLSSRTYIWAEAVSQIKNKLFLGHGIGDTYNLFYLDIHFTDRVPINGTFSAHNQWLQGLYEMGLVGIGIIALLFLATDVLLHREKNKDISGIFRIIIIALMMMLMAESPGWNSLVCVLYFGCVICTVLNATPNNKQMQKLMNNNF